MIVMSEKGKKGVTVTGNHPSLPSKARRTQLQLRHKS
jgi:hypothetical protein